MKYAHLNYLNLRYATTLPTLQFFYGAGGGTRHEPGVNDIVKFAHLCLHDEEIIENIKEFLINCND